MTKRIIAVWIVAIAGSALLAVGCGSGNSDSSASQSENTFVLSEFTIVPPKHVLESGHVTITADNVGGEVHELVILRAGEVETLSKKPDGSLDEEKIAANDKIGEIEDVAAGSRKSATFDLPAGKYVAVCNLVDEMAASSTSMAHGSDMGPAAGHVHFAQGMHATFTVT
jgi:hypothetical protein